jgi:hypothetical protein
MFNLGYRESIFLPHCYLSIYFISLSLYRCYLLSELHYHYHTPGQIIGLNTSSRGIPSSGVGASYIASYFPSSFFDISKSIFRSVNSTTNSPNKRVINDRKDVIDDNKKDEINDKDVKEDNSNSNNKNDVENRSLKSRSPSLGHDKKIIRYIHVYVYIYIYIYI